MGTTRKVRRNNLKKSSPIVSKEEKSPKRTQDKANLAKTVNHYPVVGIGSSAGGLEALKELLEALPLDTGMAFILVQHLDPTHESLAPEILSRSTRMPVHEVKEDTRVEPDHIYTIPPNFDMVLLHGVLNLIPMQSVLTVNTWLLIRSSDRSQKTKLEWQLESSFQELHPMEL